MERIAEPHMTLWFVGRDKIVVEGVEAIHHAMEHFDEYDDVSEIEIDNFDGLNLALLPLQPSIHVVRIVNCVFVEDTPIPFVDGVKSILLNKCGNVTINNIPDTVTHLYVNDCGLSELPVLPDGLISLGCSSNQIQQLPALPERLEVLCAEDNILTELPSLPLGIVSVYVEWNQIDALPDDIIRCYRLDEFLRDERVVLTRAQEDFFEELGVDRLCNCGMRGCCYSDSE